MSRKRAIPPGHPNLRCGDRRGDVDPDPVPRLDRKASREGVNPSSRGEALAGSSSGPEDPANDSDRHGRGVAGGSDLDPPRSQHPGRRDRQAPRRDVGRVGATGRGGAGGTTGRRGRRVEERRAHRHRSVCARSGDQRERDRESNRCDRRRDVETGRADEGRTHLVPPLPQFGLPPDRRGVPPMTSLSVRSGRTTARAKHRFPARRHSRGAAAVPL